MPPNLPGIDLLLFIICNSLKYRLIVIMIIKLQFSMLQAGRCDDGDENNDDQEDEDGWSRRN